MNANHVPLEESADHWLAGLPPVVSPQTAVLVLGSFPSARSLVAREYYAHPHNQFWKILQAIWPRNPLPARYPQRCEWLLERGLGLWDVYARCRRAGSLDAAIRDAQPNDIAGLRLPRLAAIAHNGAESHRQARHAAALGVPAYRLPSSSPAHAAMRFDDKACAWRTVMARHGLV
ncbi:MAG: DNA-deoxyinosine glycosylase [Xenophilus sp.]